jgi:N-methylhydantoinase B
MQTFDPVNLGILWDRLISISDEIVETLVRTSFSSIVREGYDLSVMLFDKNGRMLCQGTRSIPVFIGTAPITLAYMLERFPPETLVPGDVVITNDPMFGTGHLFDISVMRPVHRDGRLVGYTMSITHLPDIGGMGFSATAAEMFHEGLRLTPVKLIEAGRLNRTVVDIIRANVRVPEQVMGDIMANVACNEVGGRQLLDFMSPISFRSRPRSATSPSGPYVRRSAKSPTAPIASASISKGLTRPCSSPARSRRRATGSP